MIPITKSFWTSGKVDRAVSPSCRLYEPEARRDISATRSWGINIREKVGRDSLSAVCGSSARRCGCPAGPEAPPYLTNVNRITLRIGREAKALPYPKS